MNAAVCSYSPVISKSQCDVAPEQCLHLLAPELPREEERNPSSAQLCSILKGFNWLFFSFILACLMRQSDTFSKPRIKMPLYLLADGSRHRYWEESDDASAQVFPFSLLTEQTQLLLLLLVQRVTVLRLQEMHRYAWWRVHTYSPPQ